jgi:hypothetical protein
MKLPYAVHSTTLRRPGAGSQGIVAMRLGAALLVAGLLAGCGQSGPLYFPGQKPPSKSSSSSR